MVQRLLAQVPAIASFVFMRWVFGHAIDADWSEGKVSIFFVGSAIHLEWEVCTSAHADIGSFKETEGRIQPNRKIVGQIGRGLHRKAIGHRMVPVLGLDNLYVCLHARSEEHT